MQTRPGLNIKYTSVATALILLIAVYITSFFNYLLFHGLAEIFSVTVAVGIYMFAWNSRRIMPSGFFLFLGIGFLFVGFLDVLHTFAYSGMGVFRNHSANLPTQLWVAARFMQSMTLLLAFLFVNRKFNATAMLCIYALANVILLFSIFSWGVFPDCFIQGSGLTPFKIISEYIICGVLLVCILLLAANRKWFPGNLRVLIIGALCATILAELSFTLYATPHSTANTLGHLLKVVSFIFIYQAIIVAGIRDPFHILYSQVQEDAERFKQMFHGHNAVMLLIDPDSGNIVEANQAAVDFYGYGAERLHAMTVFDLNQLPPGEIRAIMQAAERGDHNHFEFPHKIASGEIRTMEAHSNPIVVNGKRLLFSINNDITEIANSQKKLRDSERKFRELADSITDIFIALDRNMCYTHWNKAFEKYCGIKAEDGLGKSMYDLFPESRGTDVARAYEDVLKTGESRRLEHKAVTTDRYMETSIYPTRDGVSAYVKDITDQYNAQTALQQSEALWRSLTESSPDHILTLDKNLKIEFSNSASPGLTVKDIIGHSICDYLPETQKEMAQATLRRTLETGEPGTYETTDAPPQGPPIYYETIATPRTLGHTGEIIGLTLSTRDITSRKQAEEDLKNRESTLQKIFDILPVGLWFADKDGRLLRGNPAGIKIWGAEPRVPPDEYGVFTARRMPSGEEVQPDDWALVHTIREGATIVDELLEIDAFDGVTRTILNSTAPVLDEHGRIQGAIVVNQDITEHMTSEEERENLHRQLLQSQKMEAIGQLAGGIAHDFNNMLTVIMGSATLAMLRTPKTDPNYMDLQAIIDAAEQSADLTKKLLAFARKEIIRKKNESLFALLDDLRGMLVRSIPKTVAVSVSASRSIIVDCDQTLIKQAVMNICLNSAHAMPSGGSLSINAYARDFPPFPDELSEHVESGAYCLIRITDTGHGMDPGLLQKITEPFFTTKGLGKGTGLGLSVTHGILKSHEGHLAFESKPGKGTSAYILLPLAAGDQAQSPVKPERAGMQGSETVLVIDDEEPILHLTQRILEAQGYQTILASSGRQGVEKYKAAQSDIAAVILDLIMPEIDGAEVFRQIKDINPDVKILFASGYGIDENAIKLMSTHERFVPKPYNTELLCKTLRALLDEPPGRTIINP